MTANFKLFREIFFIVLIGVLLVVRFVNIDVENEQIKLFVFYYSIAIGAYLFSKIRFTNAINPISIFVPFLFLLSYSFIRLSDQQVPYSWKTFSIINISIFSYLFFASLHYDYKPIKIFKFNNSLRRKFIFFICIMTYLTFVLECYLFGFVPIFNILNSSLYLETNDKLIPFLHYFIVLNSFIPAWLYIYYKEKIISKKVFRILLLGSIFILLNYLSRQVHLLFILSFFISYLYYNKLNMKSLFRIVVVVILVFFGVGYLKTDSEMTISASEYFRILAGVSNDQVSLFEAVFVEYSSKRFSVLDAMVNLSDKINYLGYGIYTFRPFLSFFLFEKIGVVQRIPELNSEVRVGTFLIDPYLDFGIIGVFIINSFYGYLSARYYNQFKENRPEAIIKFSIIIFCVFMGMFINYYNSMLIWLGFIFNKMLIGGLKSENKFI
ncbi:O-antigen polymerase [Flavobacterium reichenbachii]|uniref:Oligosaccharide repeat unit polymerase n=1 Tax=Flavobacterium reichenbachii TaxID=362418 RepID=A0A085ZLA8_9FLAO|nr:O-antigen polymerase [Flavobacterium reichenbachii]KFF05222.1 hypothetical protein IW19_06620 [Flavobacterium reichenbachii]OXB16111.1 hypothetical protein B0A68_07535 [Flavobacterium reichenbachii]